jgi:hypothetical protein
MNSSNISFNKNGIFIIENIKTKDNITNYFSYYHEFNKMNIDIIEWKYKNYNFGDSTYIILYIDKNTINQHIILLDKDINKILTFVPKKNTLFIINKNKYKIDIEDNIDFYIFTS